MRSILTIFLLGFCVKAAFLACTEPAGRDSWELGRIAEFISQGKGFISPFGSEREDRACIHFAPAVPAYLGALQVATGSRAGSQAAAAWINVLLSALTGVLLLTFGTRLFDKRTGLTAGIIYSLCPASCYYVASSWSCTILAFTGIVWLILATRLRERPSLWGVAGFGAATGVMALIDTPFLLVAPVAVLAAMIPTKRIGWVVGGSVLSLLMFLVVASPWMYRCWQVTDGHLIPVRGNFGMELWIGNHPGAELPTQNRTYHPFTDPIEEAIYEPMGELEYNRHCLERAKEWISSNPEKFYGLIPVRMAKYWLGESIVSPDEIPVKRVLKVFLQGIPLVFALLGIGLAIRDRRPVLLLVACLVLVPLPHYVTHSGWTRYRLPLDPVIYLLAAHAISAFFKSKMGSDVEPSSDFD